MKKPLLTKSGAIDKRSLNGNNGLRRGPDKKPRKKASTIEDMSEEAIAGLRHRMEQVLEYYGSKRNLARRCKTTCGAVDWWVKRGRISPRGAESVHRDYLKNGRIGFTASFCRPDLKFDNNGKCKGGRKIRKEFLK